MAWRQVVDGFTYDTRRAVPVTATYDRPLDEDNGWVATLYFVPKGNRWFLAGEGGPKSQFASGAEDGNPKSGAGIVPVSPERARCILEQANAKIALEQYAEVLGNVVEDDRRDKVVRFRVSDDELDFIKKRAEEQPLTVAQFIRKTIGC
jgi:hypothetical protein